MSKGTKLRDMIQLIMQDYFRYESGKGLLHFMYRLWRYPAFRILLIFRILQGGKKGLLLKPYYYHLMNKYMIDLPLTVKIGGGCLMPHGGPIVFNLNAVVGKNATIHPGVLIGGMRGKGVPVIGDNCFIGNGAKIIGNVKIGDWCFICPNTVVVKDQVPESVISGIPSKVLNMEGKKNCNLYLK